MGATERHVGASVEESLPPGLRDKVDDYQRWRMTARVASVASQLVSRRPVEDPVEASVLHQVGRSAATL